MEFETLATGYGLVEGPRTDEQNRLYYSDVRGGGVFRRSPDGEIEALLPARKFVGGIALNEGGGLQGPYLALWMVALLTDLFFTRQSGSKDSEARLKVTRIVQRKTRPRSVDARVIDIDREIIDGLGLDRKGTRSLTDWKSSIVKSTSTLRAMAIR